LQLAQPVLSTEGVGGAHAHRSHHDPPHGLVHRLRVLFEQGLQDSMALGHPGPLVEQGRHLEERREVDRHHCPAQRLRAR
jgi:hypothetical protein